MKKLLFIIPLLAICLNVKATNYYWIGNSTAVWGATGSWSTVGFGGVAAGSIPGAADDVFIGNGSTNVTVTLGANYLITSLTLGGSGQLFINGAGKLLTVSGNVTDANTGTTGGGTATIRMTGTATLSSAAVAIDQGKLPNLTFVDGSNVTLSGVITIGGSSTVTDSVISSGTVNYGTSTMIFYYNNTIKGSLPLYNARFQGNGGSFTISNTITVYKDLKLSETGTCILNTGTIQLYGNLVDSNSNTGSTGSATIVMLGGGNRTYSFIAGTWAFNFTVNKTGGTVSPAAGTTTFSVRLFELDGGTFIAPSGVFMIGSTSGTTTAYTIFNQTGGTFNQSAGTVLFRPYGNNNINTIHVQPDTRFYNVEIAGFTPQYPLHVTSATGDTIQVKDSLTHTSGYLEGTWNVGGNLIVKATANPAVTGTIILSGSASTTYSYATGGRTSSVVINKADTAATVTPATGTSSFYIAAFTLNKGKFTAPSGTFSVGPDYGNNTIGHTIFNHAGGKFYHNNGLTVFEPKGTSSIFTVDVIASTLFYNAQIKGTNYMYPVYIAAAAGDTIHVKDSLTHTSGFLEGAWNLEGNLIVGATANSSPTGTVILSGSASTTYSYATGGRTSSVVINKSDTAATVTAAAGTTDFYIAAFTLNKGKFTAPTGTFSMGPNYGNNSVPHTIFNHIGGKFYHNNGLTAFEARGGTSIFTVDVIPTTLFYDVQVNASTYMYPVYITGGTGDTIQVYHNLTHTLGCINGIFNVRGNLTVGATANGGTGTILLSDSTSTTYGYTTGGVACIIKINKTNMATVTPASNPMDFTARGLILASGAFTAPTGTLTLGAAFTSSATIFTHAGGTFNANNGTVKISAIGGGSIILSLVVLHATQFNNLTFYGPPGMYTTTFTCPLGDTIRVNNNLYLQDGFINVMPLLVKGNASAATTFDGDNSELIFTGSNAQTFDLTGVTTSYSGKITIDKAANNVTLASAVTMNTSGQTLSLKKGHLITTSTNLLTIGNGAVVSGASDSSFVDGPVKKVGNAAFIFPVGKGSYYNPVSISAPSSTTDAFMAEYFNSGKTDSTALDTSLTHISNCRYWHLYRTAGAHTVTVRLFWHTPDTCDIYTTSTLKIAYLNNSLGKWQAIASKALGTTSNGRDSSTAAISNNYGTFTIGKKSPLLFAHAGIDKLYCSGGSATIGASPTATGGLTPYSYSWSPATGLSSSTAAQPTASPTATTSYVLTVTDLDHTVAKDTIIVTVNPNPTVDAGPDHLFLGGSLILTGNPTAYGGTGSLNYSWSPSTGISNTSIANPVATVTVTTTYYLTVTDSLGCFNKDTVLLTVDSTLTSQVYVNKDFEVKSGSPDTTHWAATAYGSFEQIVIVGNTVDSSYTKLYVAQYDVNGNLEWEKEYADSTGLNAYGTAVKIDALGYVYVAGASITSTPHNYDYLIQKYDFSGNLIWTQHYNGPGSSYDVASALDMDTNGDIYVTGSSYGLTTQLDFCTIKLDNSGSILWTKRYDNASLTDVANLISVIGNKITVSGSSANTYTDWDICTIQYDLSGSVLTTRRDTSSGDGYDVATAIARDNDQNIYLTGREMHGSNFSIVTMKFDSSLTQSWKENFTSNSLSNIGNDVKVDAQGNVYVCGNLGTGANIYKGGLLKYNSSGSFQWENNFFGKDQSLDCEMNKLALVNNNGNVGIYVSGSADNGNGRDLMFWGCGSDGKPTLKRTYNSNVEIANPISMNVVTNQKLYFTTLSNNGITRNYSVIKLELANIPPNLATNSKSNGNYVDNQLIVRFDPKLVNTSFVDNRESEFAYIRDVLPDSIIELIYNKTNWDYEANGDPIIYKVFKWMTYSDSLSITRLGDTIRMNKDWSTLVMQLPSGKNVSEINDSLNTLVADTLNKLPGYIEYSQYDFVSKNTGTPNDVYFDNQSSLINTLSTYPNANINLDPAWDIETGKSYVKVGILEDDAIWWQHEDFGNGGSSGKLSDTKIVAGHNFFSDVDLAEIDKPDEAHATAVAGIIGALRNNGIGIAGIAGGDGDINSGVSLYSLCYPGFDQGVKQYVSAIEFAATNSTNGTGYGINVLNMSWTDVSSPALEAAMKYAYHNGCVSVASRGNYFSNSKYAVNDLEYPACYINESVINVGASDQDGFTKEITSDPSRDNLYASMYGGNVDLIAPGDVNIVLTTFGPPGSTPLSPHAFSDPSYTEFNGTSSAAPHVAGVAALMMSRHNVNQGYSTNLDVDDVKYLFDNYSNDITGTHETYTYSPGYDQYSGNGLLNAGAVMAMINKPYYWIEHSKSPTRTSSQVTSNTRVVLANGSNDVPAGSYYADRYAVTLSYSDIFPSNEEVVTYWDRNLYKYGISAVSPITGAPYNGIVSTSGIGTNSFSKTTTVYCWHLVKDNSGGTMDKWVPTSPDNLQSEYSLLIHGGIATNTKDVETTNSFLSIYPNPTSSKVWISIITDKNSKTSIQLFDLAGRLIKTVEYPNLDAGSHLFYLDVDDLPAGIYLVNFRNYKSNVTTKLVVTH